MSKVNSLDDFLKDLADGIRTATGSVAEIKAQDMRAKIESIPKTGPDGGITPSGSTTVIKNGTYDVTGYASVVVNVPTNDLYPENQAVLTSFAVAQNNKVTASFDLYELGLLPDGEESTSVYKVEVYNVNNKEEYYVAEESNDWYETTDDKYVDINLPVETNGQYKIKITYDCVL